MASTATDRKFCEHCLTFKPVMEFRRRTRVGSARQARCRSCHNQAERLRRAKRRAKRDGDTIAKFAAGLKNDDRPQQIEFLCRAMISHFDGLQGFIGSWLHEFATARDERPGSARVLNFYLAIVKLINFSQKYRRAPSQMTDSELSDELASVVAGFAENQPELLAEPLIQCGWQVSRPMPPQAG